MFALKSWNQLSLIIALRYILIAGIMWTVWYVLRRKKAAYRKIQLRFPTSGDYRREILFSLITVFVFTAVAGTMLLTPVNKYTLHYDHISEYPLWYFWLAFPLMFVLHDAYFYWTHRMMHHPALFKLFHLVHHKSTNPSPWAALAFHPLEAVVEAGIFPIMLMIMPTTVIHLFFFFFLMMLYNVYGHLGWEIYPKGFSRHWIGRWVNTSVNHNMHHQYFKGNYGLYFLWWDRWMGTIRKDYDNKFDEVKNRDVKISTPQQHIKLPAQEIISD